MILPRGVTGFTRHGDPLPPSADIITFRTQIRAAARQCGGRLVAADGPSPAGVARNFLAARLELPGGAVEVLLNAHHPLVAFAEPPVKSGSLHFADSPALAASLMEWGGYTIPTASEWEAALRPAMLAELAEAEREQAAYWKPARVGDVAFNWWD